MTPLKSTYKQCVGRQNVGPPKTALFQCRLCSVVSPKTTQTHICITNNLPTIYFTLLYFTTSLTIYFTLLHSLKTRLFINPVLNNPNPNLFHHWGTGFDSRVCMLSVQFNSNKPTLTLTLN